MRISNRLTDTAVYWAPGSPDGYGGQSFPVPVEISCRWVNKATKYITQAGEEKVTKSIILSETELELGGYLYESDLDSTISSSEEEDPTTIHNTHEIMAMEDEKDVKGNLVVYKYML